MWLILGSVLIGLCSSAIVAFAYIMQKKAYLQITGTNRKVYKTCTWLIGFALMFFGSILSLGMSGMENEKILYFSNPSRFGLDNFNIYVWSITHF